jgi:hypothetical protein
VILDTKGNIFGGFTPVKWESGDSHYKADDNSKSFLFTLKNPHNISMRRCLLKPERKNMAITCSSLCGPNFNDLFVSDNCKANTESFSELDFNYTKNDRKAGSEIFTGSKNFKVQEIEVFEILD